MFGVLVMGWLLSFVVPISVLMLIVLILLIITIIIRMFAQLFIPIVGPIISMFLIPLIILYGGAFLVCLVVFILALFIYYQFSEFLNIILEGNRDF